MKAKKLGIQVKFGKKGVFPIKKVLELSRVLDRSNKWEFLTTKNMKLEEEKV